ncbi:hypothetical protein BT96DRAFT_989465 [Gymnopus androsaceus JB14]|uniref:DUF6534 domain-containing protein n=1 Tax=Gymnopus androsaceus JB14 TaxID=1447944 RepID=A0A6A4I1M7_9AGAR|nr:hypothetical protein BT96DRAFT_989465 [Gymnopus androsaceus JB14]
MDFKNIISSINGVTYSQTWFYFSSQSTGESPDRVLLKSMVIVVVLLDFVHQVFTSHWLYSYCVTNFGNSDALNILPWSYYGMVYPTAFVTVIAQRYGFEIMLLGGLTLLNSWMSVSRSYVIAGAIWCISLAQFAALLYYVARVIKIPFASELATLLGGDAIIVNALGASWSKVVTNHVLHSIMMFSVTTGIMSSVCAIIVLSITASLPNTNIELAFYFLLTRLYSNSFLATLNSRDHLRDRNYSGSNGVITTSNFIQTRTGTGAALQPGSSHELDDFPHRKASTTQHFGESRGEEEAVISVKVDRITDTDYS